mmetsp:Transcript_28021/g.96419  ORF Transcript_28021/g.96419 Transcript_28021/m.96419 type:complete len:243 (-) Transcript_28021:175-903(-)
MQARLDAVAYGLARPTLPRPRRRLHARRASEFGNAALLEVRVDHGDHVDVAVALCPLARVALAAARPAGGAHEAVRVRAACRSVGTAVQEEGDGARVAQRGCGHERRKVEVVAHVDFRAAAQHELAHASKCLRVGHARVGDDGVQQRAPRRAAVIHVHGRPRLQKRAQLRQAGRLQSVVARAQLLRVGPPRRQSAQKLVLAREAPPLAARRCRLCVLADELVSEHGPNRVAAAEAFTAVHPR